MPVQVSYPGVYIEEIPTTAQTVTAASTSATLFADFFPRGPMDTAIRVDSWTEFMRHFGGLDQRSEASYGIYQFFNNGGQTAWVVRLGNGTARAAQIKVSVVSPSVSVFAHKAAAASQKANAAALKAIKDLAVTPVYKAALDAGSDAERAAKATMEAAAAARAAGEELNSLIERYNAEYGPEAGSTLEDARAAAFAAEKAATAATAAQEAAAAAAKDQNIPKPTGENKPQAPKDAAGDATTLIGYAVTSAKGNCSTDTKPKGNVPTALQDAQTALTAAEKTTGGAPEFVEPLKLNVQSGQSALQSAQLATKALTAQQARIEAKQYPTTGSFSEALSAAEKAVSDIEVWLTSAQNIENSNPPANLKIPALVTAIQSALTSAVVAVGSAQTAFAALVALQTSLDELRSEPGFETFGRKTLEKIQQAITEGKDLEALGIEDGTPDKINKEIQALTTAEQTLDKVLKAVTSDQKPTDSLTGTVSDLNDQADKISKSLSKMTLTDTIGKLITNDQLSEARQLLEWEVANEAAYLAVAVLADLVETVVPLDAAMDAAQEALAAARQAEIEARKAMQKAQVATLAGLADEGDSQQVMIVAAANPGVWGNSLKVEIAPAGAKPHLFNLKVEELALQNDRLVTVAREQYANLTLGNATAVDYAPSVVNHESQLIELTYSPWKYIDVRRLADFIEDSLYQSLKWAVFQDNGPRLWAEISTEVGSFMAGLFAAGAFQGTSPSQAYIVKCDSSTTTPVDVDKGIVNILVGFAPVKPAEFVILKIQQLAGQSQGS